jgi:RNA polymerase sigma-B factor
MIREAGTISTDDHRRQDVDQAWDTIPHAVADPDQLAVDFGVWTLHVRYARTRSPEDLAALVQEYTGYALSIARRLDRGREQMDDLRQVALEALIKALKGFDPERGLPFAAYATPTIMGAIRRYYRDSGWALRVPRRVHETAASVRAASDRLRIELGRSPTTDEVARAVGLTVEELLEVQEALVARESVPIDASSDDTSQWTVAELGVADSRFELALNRVALKAAMAELTDRERDLVDLYYFQEKTQAAIAEHYGVSQMQVSRWLGFVLRRLRSHMRASEPD